MQADPGTKKAIRPRLERATPFDAIRELMAPQNKARRSIGFRVEEGGAGLACSVGGVKNKPNKAPTPSKDEPAGNMRWILR